MSYESQNTIVEREKNPFLEAQRLVILIRNFTIPWGRDHAHCNSDQKVNLKTVVPKPMNMRRRKKPSV